MKTMRGFAMLKIGETGWVTKGIPACGPSDAICRPLALAPCTSDVHTVWAGAIGERHNMILGHEAVGEVVEVGDLVKHFKVGDRVLVSAITPDWGSPEAQDGYAMHSGGMLSGWKFSNFKDGVFAEYFHVNEADANLALMPEGMDLGAACMLSDMVPTGFHGAELADIQFGDNVAVIGIGPVGLMGVAAAAIRGAAELYAVGSRKNCAALALEYGATQIVNYRDGDIVEQILDMNHGPVDKVIVAGGDVDTMDQAIRMLKPGGAIGNVNYLGEGATYVCYSGGKQVAYSTATKYPIIAGGIAIGRSADGKAINRMLQLSPVVIDKLGAASVMSGDKRYETADDMQVYLWSKGQYFATSLPKINTEDYKLIGWYDNFGCSGGRKIRILVAVKTN